MKYLKKYIIPIGLCIILDQIVKIIIYHYFFNLDMDIVGNIIRFNPTINHNLSWGGNFIALFRNFGFLIFINLLLVLLITSCFSFYRYKKSNTSMYVILLYIFALSGCFCSLIDKVIWKGSLDFIQFSGLFIFDIKDVYLSIFQILFVFIGIKNSKEISTVEYLKWCINVNRKDIS